MTKEIPTDRKMLIIGSGPSTRELVARGLDNLRTDVDTFGMGAQYRFYRRVGWWPTYYALCDPKVVFSHRKNLAAAVEDPEVPTRQFYFSYPVTKHARLEIIPHSTTGDFCFRTALSLGYKEIYLIGLEGHYVEEIVGSRPLGRTEYEELDLHRLELSPHHRSTLRIITDTPDDNPNYFFHGYQKAGDVYSLPQTHVHQRGWNESAEVALAAGARVLNLSPISQVEHFPRSRLTTVADRLFAADPVAR